MKEFRILQNCTICGESFGSDYKLLKHISQSHPETIPVNGSYDSTGAHHCSCGNADGGGCMEEHEHNHAR